jgi:signal transduction histidine kinase
MGLIDNIILFLLMILFGTKWKTIVYFVIINTFVKIIPLYYLQNDKIRIKDIIFTLFLFLLFIGWLHLNNESLQSNTKLVYDSLVHNKNKTPFLQLMKKIEENVNKLK